MVPNETLAANDANNNGNGGDGDGGNRDRQTVLEERLAQLRQRIITRARLRRVYGVGGIFLLLISLLLFYLLRSSESEFLSKFIPLTIGVYSAIVLLFAAIASPKEYDIQVRDIENELDLLNFQDVAPEQKAEKLFRVHQFELEKYYSLTRKQTQWIFSVGVGCIVLGFAIIIFSLSLIMPARTTIEQMPKSANRDANQDETESIPPITTEKPIETNVIKAKTDISRGISDKIVLAALGAIGAILSNFIAVIYLKMHSEAVRSLTQFHNRLVLTHHVHFSNFLIAKIEDEILREKTLADLAMSLVNQQIDPIQQPEEAP